MQTTCVRASVLNNDSDLSRIFDKSTESVIILHWDVDLSKMRFSNVLNIFTTRECG